MLQYFVEEGLINPHDGDRWTEADIDAAARELDERKAYTSEAMYFLHLGVDAAEYFGALHEAWNRVRDEFGDGATSVNSNQDYFVITVHPPRYGRDGYVEFTLCDDARRDLEAERNKAAGMKRLRLQLVLAHADRVRFGLQRVFDFDVVLFGAQDNADRRLVAGAAFVVVEQIQVEGHLARVFRFEFADFQVKRYQGLKKSVVEQQIDARAFFSNWS